jgi:hypothetical protein
MRTSMPWQIEDILLTITPVQGLPEPLAAKLATLTFVTAVSPVPSLMFVNFMMAMRSPSIKV